MPDTEAPKVAALPTEIAARLAVDSVEKAIAEIDKRELASDKLAKDLASVTAERDALKAATDKREAEDAAAEVDALITSNRISADKRDAALRSYKADRESFRALYPVQPAAPQASLLDKPNLPAERGTPTAPLADVNPIDVRANALIKEGQPYDAAWSRAMNDYQAGKLNPDGSLAA